MDRELRRKRWYGTPSFNSQWGWEPLGIRALVYMPEILLGYFFCSEVRPRSPKARGGPPPRPARIRGTLGAWASGALARLRRFI